MNVVTFNFTISVQSIPFKTGTHKVRVPKKFCTNQELLKEVLEMYISNTYIFGSEMLVLPDGPDSAKIEIHILKSQQD